MNEMRKQWTEEEVDVLRDLYGSMSLPVLADKLNRTSASVQGKASKLGINGKNNQEWMTVSDFCEATRIHRSSVDYWIRTNEFPTKRTRKYRRIYPSDFWKWAEKNKHRIEWNDFPAFALGAEPKWLEEVRKANGKKITKRRPWTTWELAELEYMLSQNKYTYPELSERLNRTHAAIKCKIYDLELPWPLYVNRAKVPRYTEQEVDYSVELYKKGYPMAEIAKKLNRTEAGLRGKLERSGYEFDGKKIIQVNKLK